jgi:hypothetical protein
MAGHADFASASTSNHFRLCPLVRPLAQAASQEARRSELLALLQRLLNDGSMPRLQRQWGKRRADCHEIVLAMLADISGVTPYPTSDFRWCSGYTNFGPHSWMEVDDCAIDASSGLIRLPIIDDAVTYRAKIEARGVCELGGVFSGVLRFPLLPSDHAHRDRQQQPEGDDNRYPALFTSGD